MKRITTKFLRFLGKIFKVIYRIIDVLLVTPLSKLFYKINSSIGKNNNNFDKFINNPNTLIFVSLVFAFAAFIMVDLKVINLTETEAVVLSNQTVSAVYNEEAYVVEGIPDTVDVVLMGKKSSLYLAEQLGEHKLTLDLTDYGEGTHKVAIKYNNPINTLDYKLDPSKVTIVIYPKVSETRTVTNDILNTDKLDDKLIISSVELNKTEVTIKSYKEKLETVASVKAIVDANALNANEADTYTLDNVKLVAYDERGTEITDVEIVPETLTATVEITSPSKTIPVKVVPKGEVASGSAISKITSNINNVTLYGDEAILNTINELEVEIDVSGISSNKTYQETIKKPSGVRSISATAATIKVEMEEETSKEIEDVPITFENLDTSNYKVSAVEGEPTKVNVVVKGVETLINKLSVEDITAYVDLSDLEPGIIEVPIMVKGNDNKLTYTSRTTKVKVKISKK